MKYSASTIKMATQLSLQTTSYKTNPLVITTKSYKN
ncbi:hypothetical protein MED222_05940 [Vibrio sp. MED222]|nr:hypothetical protein MED222_05940 [Vibrio sp. MED222]